MKLQVSMAKIGNTGHTTAVAGDSVLWSDKKISILDIRLDAMFVMMYSV